MPDLLSSPNELVCRMLELTHPDSLVSFALANRQIYAKSLHSLQIHRDRLSNLRLIHDRNLINVPSEMRNAVPESNLAWYTRSLEVWGCRRNFSTWKSPVSDEGKPAEDPDSDKHRNWPEQHNDYSHLGLSYFGDVELDQCHSLLLHTLHLSEARAEIWMKRLESGYDEPLKVLLMALLPRLNKITFMLFDTWENSGSAIKNPLRLFSESLRRLALLPALQWPCFQSLAEVTVGQTHNLRNDNEKYCPTPYTIAPLLLLPTIQKLTLNSIRVSDGTSRAGSHPEDDDEYSYVWEWESHISACQDLQFTNCFLNLKTATSLLGSIKALRSFTLINGFLNEGELIDSLLKNAKLSLEVLRLDHSFVPCDMRILKGFENLRRLEVVDTLLIDPTTYKGYRFDEFDRYTFGSAD